MFGKPGRPPEDRIQRQREIWAAVSPLIEKHGARKLTMRKAAAVSFLSLGGLYHYFPEKRSLVLFGLDQAAHVVDQAHHLGVLHALGAQHAQHSQHLVAVAVDVRDQAGGLQLRQA